MDVEELTIRAFVVPNRVDRWVTGLSSAKRRRATVGRLCHGDDWRPGRSAVVELSGDAVEQRVGLEARLRALGAPSSCHVVSESGEHDGAAMPLAAALAALFGEGCSLLICIPGRLALHLPEAPAAPVLLQV